MKKMLKKCSTFVQQNQLLQNQYFKRHIKPISIKQSFESIRTYFVCAQFEAWTGQNQSIIPNLVVSFYLEPDQYFILGPDKICPKIQNLLGSLSTYPRMIFYIAKLLNFEKFVILHIYSILQNYSILEIKPAGFESRIRDVCSQ